MESEEKKNTMEAEKPQYLYHGSPYRFEKLIPQPACGASERESMFAVYAAGSMKEVIPFALPIRWYPDTPEGRRDFRCEDGRTEILCGTLDPDGVGYVYRVKSDGFVRIDGWQWVSETETMPEEIVEIKVRDYWDTVRFSQEAAKMQEDGGGNRG